MGMSIEEAISHLYTYSSTMGSGQTTQEQHEDAKRVAIETMRKYQKLEQEPTTKNDLGVDWDELKRKILMEVDGGTDDKWLRYTDVCDRISDSIDEYKAEREAQESEG